MRIYSFAILAFAMSAVPADAQAGPIYDLVHISDAFGNTGPSDTIGPQSTPIDYDFAGITYFTGANFGEVHANVNPGSIGIFARALNNGGFAPQRQEVTGRFAFDVLFSSPTNDPISVIMNLELAGEMSGGGSAVAVGVTTVNTAGGQGSGGQYIENINPFTITRSGMLSSFVADGTKQTVSTGTFIQVPVNIPTRFSTFLMTGQAYSTLNSTVSFGDTLSLATSGDVFTILGPNAGDITVNSTDAGIVDNRFGQASAVPEPSSMALLGIGALGLFGCSRRRERRRERANLRDIPRLKNG